MSTRFILFPALASLLLLASCSDKGDDSAPSEESDTDTDTDVDGDASSGAALYASCSGCHGADGTGGIDIGGTLSSDLSVEVPAQTDEQLSDAITNGVGTAMPSQYTDAQDVADVVAYLRVTFP